MYSLMQGHFAAAGGQLGFAAPGGQKSAFSPGVRPAGSDAANNIPSQMRHMAPYAHQARPTYFLTGESVW